MDFNDFNFWFIDSIEMRCAEAPGSLPLVGPALIGNAGAGTTIHRQAVAVVAS